MEDLSRVPLLKNVDTLSRLMWPPEWKSGLLFQGTYEQIGVNGKIIWYKRNAKEVITNSTNGGAPIQLEFVKLDFPLFGLPKADLEAVKCEPIHVVLGDVSRIMRDDAASGSLFVIPSQLNSVEYPNAATTVEKVTDYMHDNTGGPVAQLSADVALAQALIDMASRSMLNSVPFVNKFEREMTLNNGYLQVHDMSDETAEQFLLNLTKSLIETRLTVAKNVPVKGLVRQGPLQPMVYEETPLRIDIAYASGVPYAYAGDAGFDNQVINTSLHAKQVCKLMIYAQYTSALRYAVNSRVKRAYLMLLGGKTFNNELSWIVKGIVKAQRNASLYATRKDLTMPEIYVITYTENEYTGVSELLRALKVK